MQTTNEKKINYSMFPIDKNSIVILYRDDNQECVNAIAVVDTKTLSEKYTCLSSIKDSKELIELLALTKDAGSIQKVGEDYVLTLSIYDLSLSSKQIKIKMTPLGIAKSSNSNTDNNNQKEKILLKELDSLKEIVGDLKKEIDENKNSLQSEIHRLKLLLFKETTELKQTIPALNIQANPEKSFLENYIKEANENQKSLMSKIEQLENVIESTNKELSFFKSQMNFNFLELSSEFSSPFLEKIKLTFDEKNNKNFIISKDNSLTSITKRNNCYSTIKSTSFFANSSSGIFETKFIINNTKDSDIQIGFYKGETSSKDYIAFDLSMGSFYNGSDWKSPKVLNKSFNNDVIVLILDLDNDYMLLKKDNDSLIINKVKLRLSEREKKELVPFIKMYHHGDKITFI